jgi:hypothetical protein
MSKQMPTLPPVELNLTKAKETKKQSLMKYSIEGKGPENSRYSEIRCPNTEGKIQIHVFSFTASRMVNTWMISRKERRINLCWSDI